MEIYYTLAFDVCMGVAVCKKICAKLNNGFSFSGGTASEFSGILSFVCLIE